MRGRMIAAVALVAVGLVWVGQGLGVLQGSSFMVGDPLWAVIGAALILGGAGIGVSVVRGRRPPGPRA